MTFHTETSHLPFERALPLVVFIHGAGHAALVWRPIAHHMAAHGYSVAAVDLPGHGESDEAAVASVEQQADLVARWIAGSPHRSATVVGHSLGGLIALDVAGRHPEVVDAVVLTGTAAGMPVNPALLEKAMTDAPGAIDLLSRWAHSRSVPPEVVDGLSSILGGHDHATLHAGLKACDDYRGGPTVAANVSIPTLLVLGEDDVMVDDNRFSALEEAIPHAVTVRIPNAGHNVGTDQPDALTEAIETFLESHRSSL